MKRKLLFQILHPPHERNLKRLPAGDNGNPFLTYPTGHFHSFPQTILSRMTIIVEQNGVSTEKRK